MNEHRFTAMYDGVAHSVPFHGLEVLAALSSDSFAARHEAYGECVLERYSGPRAKARVVARHRLLARAQGEETRDLVKRPLATAADGDVWFLLTTRVPGVPLSEVSRRRFIERPRMLAKLGIELLETLDFLHRRRIVHGSLALRHVIVGERLGLVGLGGSGEGQPTEDLAALGRLVHRLATGGSHQPGEQRIARLHPGFGSALDEWVDDMGAGRVEDAAEARAWLYSVAATMPSRPRGERSRAPSCSLRRPTRGRIESVTPPSSEMLARIGG